MIQWKHRLVSLLVCAAMLFSLCPTAAWGEEETTGVTPQRIGNSNTYWSLDSGTLTITGKGEMPDVSSDGPPWYSDRAKIKSVVIEEGVTSVGASAFYGSYTALTSVEFPSTLTAIGADAFRECENLTSVQLPERLEAIGECAFMACSLKEVQFPSTLTKLGDSAFSFCEALTSVVLPERLETIGNNAFFGCTDLTSVVLPEGLVTIGSNAFADCTSLTQIRVPASVETIGRGAFSALESVTFMWAALPDGVSSGAFQYTEIQTIYVPYWAEVAYSNKLSEWGLWAAIVAMLAAPKNLAWDTATPGTATWSEVNGADSYEVRLYREGSSEPAQTVTVEKDENGTLPVSVALAAPQEGSYTFTVTAIAPTDEQGKKEYADSEESAHSDTATFCEVEFDANNGTQIAPQLVAAGGLAIEPEQPNRTGYTFAGWYADEKFTTTKWDFAASKVPTDGVTLYAKWEAKTYTVTVENDEHGSAYAFTESADKHITKAATDETVTLTAEPNDGYRFAGWAVVSGDNPIAVTVGEENALTATFTMPAGDVTVKATFTAEEYNVTLVPNKGTLPDEKNIKSYTYGVGADLPTEDDITREGYTFKGWYEDSDYSGGAVTAIDKEEYGNKTFYAKWEANTYNVDVTVENDRYGSAYASTESADKDTTITAATDKTVTLTAKPKNGYRFVRWEEEVPEGETGVTIENAEELTATFTMPARAVTVKAVFTAGEYNVTLECNGGTLTDGGDPMRSYTHGESMTLPTKDDITLDYYTFRGWYRDIECTEGPVEVISTGEYGDKTFYAKWELTATHIDPIAVRYIIEHYKEDADSDKGYILADTEYSVGEIGTEVTAKPKAYTGFTYNEAESSNSGTLTTISKEDDIVTLKLYYDVTRYAVTVAGSNAEESGAGRYAKGDTVTIHAGTREGYVFSGWTSDDGVTFAKADNETTTFVMPAGAVTVTAVFQAIYGVNTEHDEKEGKVAVSPDDAAEGTQVTVTAEPEDGYRFVEWKGTTVSGGETVDIIFDDPTLPETTFTMPDGAVTITAVFQALHGVNTENDGKEGKVTVSPDDAAKGTQVTVTAEPEDGYRFVEWKGTTVSGGETIAIEFEDATSPETTFTMPDGAVTITAVFEKVTPAAPEQAETGLSDEAAVLLGVGIVAAGYAAAAAYYYRDFLPVWKLGGVVKLPDGTPAANAAIELWRDGALVKTLTTDETGTFAARVPKGTYEAVVTWEQDGTAYTARASLTAETALAPAGPEDLIITPEEAEPPEEPA